ncbi:MAG: hypothetical protein U0T80_03550 [Flavobacteriaceae bacterium]
MKKRHQQKLLFLSLFLMMALNLPIILLFDTHAVVAGIPVIYIYVFSIWLLSALVSFIIVNKYNE